MKKFILPTVTALALLIGLLVGAAFTKPAEVNAQQWRYFVTRPQSKLDQLVQYLEAGYVDSLNIDSITDEVMAQVVQKLDPHSSYIPKKDLEIVNSQLQGSFSGIGVQFNIQNDTVCIVQVISGGPSEAVGLLAGDKIVQVDDSVFTGKMMNNEKVMRTLRGPKGTEVKLGIRRNGTAELLEYVITRGDIPVHSVIASFMLTDKVGFVKVDKFSETTYREFIHALAMLKSEGAEKYIVDLRENGGGYMEQVIAMANEFLEAGDGIVYSEGRAHARQEARADGRGRFRTEPLVVLIDGFSASASEIFSGAMQDNDRGTIVGRRSFGKGLVQNQIPFSDGSALRLTVARYYTPSGRCIQKPYVMGDLEGYLSEEVERYANGELFSKDSIHLADSTMYYTKQGRVVYGGGGIMPDVFVGRDTTLNTPFFNVCSNLAYTYQFAFKYVNDHRKTLAKHKTWQELEAYLLKQDILGEFLRYADSKGVTAEKLKITEAEKLRQIEKSRPLFTRYLHLYIVRDMMGDEAFYPMLERDDEMTKKALELLEK